MTKVKRTKLQWKRIIISAIVLLVFLSLLKLNNSGPLLTKNQAVEKVKMLPEVIDYLKRVPQARVEIGSEENNSYLIQVYEIKNGHTATFNWYEISKTTGKVKKELP